MRDRSRSPSARGESSSQANSRRDYGYSGSSRGGRYGGERRGRGRGGYRGGRGDYGGRGGSRYGGGNSREHYGSSSSAAEEYRSKTERNYDNSIFIGNIPFNCSSKDVEDIFNNKFNIVRADIVTNRGQSRGMATVEFANKDEVREAIAKFDHHEYRGREIFVRQDYPPPSEKNKERDFTASSTSSSSSRYSSRGGASSSSSSRYDSRYEGGKSSRFGAQGAQGSQTAQTIPKPGTEIFVGNLPFSTTWYSLKDLMRKAGQVVRADVRLDSAGKSRGFGTVVFATEEAAAKAVEEFQGYEIEGRKLDTRPGRSYENSNSSHRNNSTPHASKNTNVDRNTDFTRDVVGGGEISNTIFATNLPFVTNVDDLYELFETIGRVTQAGLQYNKLGKPTGNAVVQFELEELADLAIKNLDNYNYGGRDLSITYAKRPEVDQSIEQAPEPDMEVQAAEPEVEAQPEVAAPEVAAEPEVAADVEVEPEAEAEVEIEDAN